MVQHNLRWQRVSDEPFIGPTTGTCAPDAVTTPDILEVNGQLALFVGAVDKSQERIINFSLSRQDFENNQPVAVPEQAQIIVKPGPAEFDCHHVFDPATVFWDDHTFLYYSAVGKDQDQIGLAVSENDHRVFVKHDSPVLVGRSPEAVLHNRKIFLFYVLETPGQGYSIFASRSSDGFLFESIGTDPVLPPGSENEWDDFEVTTPRITTIDGTYYMIYAGLDRSGRKDIPRAFGLARSTDLVFWEKYPLNPIFECGQSGSWDDGAIWFGTPIVLNSNIYLLYEGGRLENILNHSPALTQVGLAKLNLDRFIAGVAKW